LNRLPAEELPRRVDPLIRRELGRIERRGSRRVWEIPLSHTPGGVEKIHTTVTGNTSVESRRAGIEDFSLTLLSMEGSVISLFGRG